MRGASTKGHPTHVANSGYQIEHHFISLQTGCQLGIGAGGGGTTGKEDWINSNQNKENRLHFSAPEFGCSDHTLPSAYL